MTVFTEGRHTGEFVLSLPGGNLAISKATIISGAGALKSGTVLGKITAGAGTAAAKSGGNTGNGTISAITTVAGVKPGIYKARFSAATVFTVEDPDGYDLGPGDTGVAYSDDVGFTITAGGTPFVAGDGFDITVAAGSAKYQASPATGADGSQIASAILLNDVDATSADVDAAVIDCLAEVKGFALAYHASVDDNPKKAVKASQLAASHIKVR